MSRLEIPYRWPRTHEIYMVVQDHWKLAPDIMTDTKVQLAGRVVVRRGQGGITFSDISAHNGAIQCICTKDMTPDYELYQEHVKLGTILGVVGLVGTSKRGQVSVFVEDWQILAVFRGSWPDKQQGIKDQDTIYRNRPLFLISELPTAQEYLQGLEAYFDGQVQAN